MTTAAPVLEAREIERETLRQILRLKVGEAQAGFVASNAVTIAQAAYEPCAWLRGLWVGETPVGLMAMIDLRPEHPDHEPGLTDDSAYLWRLMIDEAQQGRGYGVQAMELAFAQARAWGRGRFLVHVAEEPGSALPLYRRFGLVPTDRVDDGERLLAGPTPRKTDLAPPAESGPS